jgi:pyruvate,water dikinase
VIALTDRGATDPARTGAKAANLAAAAALGLPVLPGAVLTIGATLVAPVDVAALHEAWRRLSDDGRRALVVRSSSAVEDSATSSMAGVFTSVLDVRGWPALLEAVQVVLASANGFPMAVLLQPMLDAAVGGVLFGVDPVGGRTDRLLVEWVDGGPAPLVGGLISGARLVLSRNGRVVERDAVRSPALDRRTRHDLAALARATAGAFGGPQDIEWAVDVDGQLWLLQSRPITASSGQATGPTFGPGPIAETFPDALSPLEEDLWVEPLRSGIRAALEIAGGLPKRAVRRSPIVVSVGGRLAGDLDLLGMSERPSSFIARLDPRPPARRLAIAWRVGRLRRALPLLARDIVAEVDARLGEVPELTTLGDGEVLALLHRTSAHLHGVHGHEVLAGIVGDDSAGATGAAAALAALARGRASGWTDAELRSREPVVLALSAPAIASSPELPDFGVDGATIAELSPREALRLRARWLHELASRAALELGARLVIRGVLEAAHDVRYLTVEELVAVLGGQPLPEDVATRRTSLDTAPLPAAFKLTSTGVPMPVVGRRGKRLDGRGAGGGRGIGVVHDLATGPPPPGSVLIVRALEPGLAATLSGLAGIVAETGSVLSHLAILAREVGVPTVVAVDDAVNRFPPGTQVLVDGTTGEVTLHEGEPT